MFSARRPGHALPALLVCLVASVGPGGVWGASASVHTVRPNETLSHISRQYGVSAVDLRHWNGLRSDRIAVGQRLEVSPPPTYAVRPGDNLSRIAQRHGLTVAALKALNGLADERIQPGQTLRLGPGAGSASHTVHPGDNLSEIARAHGTTVTLLRRLNGLRDSRIRAGQKLRLPADPDPSDEPIQPVGGAALDSAGPLDGPVEYAVRPGDNLSLIAARFDLEVDSLRQLNGLTSDRIHPGQRLRLGTAPAAVHVVERGDALWEIARTHGVSAADIQELNGLTGSRIYPGQRLRLRADPYPGRTPATYTVTPGDNLSEIAQRHHMSTAELMALNGLAGSVIQPGQSLKVRPVMAGASRLDPSRIPWEDLSGEVEGLVRIAMDNGPYYGQRPRAVRQMGPDYAETHPPSPLRAYRQAAALWKRFEQRVGQMGRISDDLAGWHVVLDPGHGGIDPGTIVATADGDGNRLYVVEDEYVYDIALRVYVLLRLNGARADLTLLSPNHLIRHTTPPTQTFVHEMNEVFNSLALNRSDTPRAWPTGNPRGLRARVRIAREALARAPQGRTVFLSFHADIDRNSPQAPLVLYYESRDGRRIDLASRAFARALAPALGAEARTRGQPLAVLRDNPASVKVLVEVRNLAYVDQAWAMRFEELRHRDAEGISRGVLDWAEGGQLARR